MFCHPNFDFEVGSADVQRLASPDVAVKEGAVPDKPIPIIVFCLAQDSDWFADS
jgi:hypothetical protein